MSLPPRAIFSAAVEGVTDEAVLRRLVRDAGAELGAVHGKNGKAWLRKYMRGYNQAARLGLWVVLVDLDMDDGCAPPFRSNWLPNPAPGMCFRIAVRAVESWLLADRQGMARFLCVPLSRFPQDPETLSDPKQALVNLARASRNRAVRQDMLPQPGGGRRVGPAYASRLIAFAARIWRPDVAAQRADSLRRCIVRLREMARGRDDQNEGG